MTKLIQKRNGLALVLVIAVLAFAAIIGFAMLSTAWSRTDPFWMAWAGDDQSWIRLKATADTVHYDPEFLERELRSLVRVEPVLTLPGQPEVLYVVTKD